MKKRCSGASAAKQPTVHWPLEPAALPTLKSTSTALPPALESVLLRAAVAPRGSPTQYCSAYCRPTVRLVSVPVAVAPAVTL